MSDELTQRESDWRYPYGATDRFHFQHVHIFASDVAKTIEFYSYWFNAKVAWDGDYGGARNIFLKIGNGAIHLYDQAPRALQRNAVHHLGIQVVGLEELYGRMINSGLALRNPIRRHGGGGYLMLEGPDGVLLELFEPGPLRDAQTLQYYGYSSKPAGCHLFGMDIPLARTTGLIGRSIGEDSAVIQMPYNKALSNSRGDVGGGAIATALDLALAAAVRAHAPDDFSVATVELSTQFVAPCVESLEVRGRCTSRGRRICFAQGEAIDRKGQLVATATGVFALNPRS